MALARSRPEPGDTAALVVDDLAVARGGRTVVAGISFRLDRGEALQIVGDNGAGKSTLLRAIAGLLPPQAGTARMTGVPSETPLAEQSHYLGHADGLKGALTAGENLAVAAALLGGSSAPAPPATPEAALTRLGLGHLLDLPAAYLSAGQRRRVALARLLVAPRLLWLLDEPTTALDAAAQERLAAIMSAHRTQGGMIIAATHAALGLERGRVLRLGT